MVSSSATHHTDCLAVNPLCAALSPNYAVGVNLLTAVLLDPLLGSLVASGHELRQPNQRSPKG